MEVYLFGSYDRNNFTITCMRKVIGYQEPEHLHRFIRLHTEVEKENVKIIYINKISPYKLYHVNFDQIPDRG